MKYLVTLFFLIFFTGKGIGQITAQQFGEGINIQGKDSSFAMKIGIRFQTLMTANWNVDNDDLRYVEELKTKFLIRRARFKFGGYAFTPKLKYKMEIGLSNRDVSGGMTPAHGYTPRYILDAFIDWNFYRNFSLKVGQAKLPGNRERVLSSANMSLVDRSLLNSRYNIDRDIGVQLKHHFTIGSQFIFREIAAFSHGEGRNIVVGNIGGYNYTFRVEMLPFGKFKGKGDYVGGAIEYEETPKLALGFTYDINDQAPRERGQNGDFIYNVDGTYANGKTLNTFFADLMFKYKNLSVMAEYAKKSVVGSSPFVFDKLNPSLIVGRYFVGTGYNAQVGWMFSNQVELTGRYTSISPIVSINESNETEYTLGLSKYIVGHKLKVQTDISYRQNTFDWSSTENMGEDDGLRWRVQLDVHF